MNNELFFINNFFCSQRYRVNNEYFCTGLNKPCTSQNCNATPEKVLSKYQVEYIVDGRDITDEINNENEEQKT